MRRGWRHLVCGALLLGIHCVAARGQLSAQTDCGETEFALLSAIVRTLEGGAGTPALTPLLNQAAACLNDEALTPFQRFSLAYTVAFGYYLDGVLRRDALQLQNARQTFLLAEGRYDAGFGQPEKRDFARYMRSWCDLRLYQLLGDSAALNRCITGLAGWSSAGGVETERLMLLALALVYRAEAQMRGRDFAAAYADLGLAIGHLRPVGADPRVQPLLDVAGLLAVQAGSRLRLLRADGAPTDATLQGYLDGVSPCCGKRLAELAIDLRGRIGQARSLPNFPVPPLAPGVPCPPGTPESDAVALLTLQPPALPGASLWSRFANLLHFWRGRLGSLGPGGGTLAQGAFPAGAAVPDAEMVSLQDFGSRLVEMIRCGRIPGGLGLHYSGLGRNAIARANDPVDRALLALALAPLSNGCLYRVADSLLANVPRSGDANRDAEVVMLRAMAIARCGGTALLAAGEGPNYEMAVDVLRNTERLLPLNALDPPHRSEWYFLKGRLSAAILGHHEEARNYFDQTDDQDPRSAYWLHWLSQSVVAPLRQEELDALGRALTQTDMLIAGGYHLRWLRDRLAAIPGVAPAFSAAVPQPRLLPDNPPRRWDIVSDLSEANISRTLYLDLLETLTDYVGSYLVKATPPSLWWGQQPPGALQGPREFYLGSEIPVAVRLEGAPWPARLVVLRDTNLMHDDPNYNGGQFHVVTGVRHQLIISVSGFWPAYVDTFFAFPGQTLDVRLIPALRTSGFKVVRSGNQISAAKAAGQELVYDRQGHRFLLAGGAELLKQEEGKPFVQLLRFAAGEADALWFLDVANNRVYAKASSSAGLLSPLDLATYGVQQATDFARSSSGFLIADGKGGKIVEADLGLQNARGEVQVSATPTAILCLPSLRDLVWVADAYNGKILSGRLPFLQEIPGLAAARRDGLSAPARLLWLDGLNYVGVTDFFSNRLFLFLPGGDYVGYLEINGGVGPVFWSEYKGTEGGHSLVVSRGLNVLEFTLSPVGAYAFRFDSARFVPGGSPSLASGGWLIRQP